jgi:hypothetical protein
MLLGNDLYTVVDCENQYIVLAVYSTVAQCRAFCEGILLAEPSKSLAIKSGDKVVVPFNVN